MGKNEREKNGEGGNAGVMEEDGEDVRTKMKKILSYLYYDVEFAK